MSVWFDPRKQIYDLYSFDAPYDLEPTGLSDFLRGYEKELSSHKGSTPADTEDEEDVFRHLDLTFEEAEPGRHFPTSGSRPFLPGRDSSGGEHLSPSPVLGATLSQRKKLLKERRFLKYPLSG